MRAYFISYVAALFPRWTGLLFGSIDVLSVIQIIQGFRGRPTLIMPLWGWIIVLFGSFLIANLIAYSNLKRENDRLTERHQRRAYLGTLSITGQDLHHRLCRRTPSDRLADEEWESYLAWLRTLEQYLREHLDQSYVARFAVNAGVNPAFKRRQQVCGDLMVRLDRLSQFMSEFSN